MTSLLFMKMCFVLCSVVTLRIYYLGWEDRVSLLAQFYFQSISRNGAVVSCASRFLLSINSASAVVGLLYQVFFIRYLIIATEVCKFTQ